MAARSRPHQLLAARATEIQDTHYLLRLAEAIERKLARGASLRVIWAGRGAVPNCCRDGGDIEASAQAPAEMTALAKLHGSAAVEEALAVAMDAGRFGDGDLPRSSRIAADGSSRSLRV